MRGMPKHIIDWVDVQNPDVLEVAFIGGERRYWNIRDSRNVHWYRSINCTYLCDAEVGVLGRSLIFPDDPSVEIHCDDVYDNSDTRKEMFG